MAQRTGLKVLDGTDCQNIKGVILDKTEHGFRVGTKAGTITGFMNRNQIEKIQGNTLSASDIPDSGELSVRQTVQILSLSGGQGHLHCSCRSGCKTAKCKCKRSGLLCNSRCHASLSCNNK